METVNFKINLTGTGWDDEYPYCVVYVDDIRFAHGAVKPNTCFEFDVELDEDTQHSISVHYINRDSQRDVKRDSDGNITQSKGINIDSILIDDIELEQHNIVFSLGTTSYTDPDYVKLNRQDPNKYPLVFNRNTFLGAEGKYTLIFESPVYMWLLENF